MTISDAWRLVVKHESNGDPQAIGDDGRAAGLGQMWWVFRKDYWPSWAWSILEIADNAAFVNFVRRHPHDAAQGLRHLYENVYNPHAVAPDLPTEKIDVD